MSPVQQAIKDCLEYNCGSATFGEICDYLSRMNIKCQRPNVHHALTNMIQKRVVMRAGFNQYWLPYTLKKLHMSNLASMPYGLSLRGRVLLMAMQGETFSMKHLIETLVPKHAILTTSVRNAVVILYKQEYLQRVDRGVYARTKKLVTHARKRRYRAHAESKEMT